MLPGIVQKSYALRVCVCTYCTSPAACLQVETNDFPLELWRNKRALQYILKLSSKPYYHSYECVFGKNFKTLFVFRPHIIPTLGIRLENNWCAFTLTSVILQATDTLIHLPGDFGSKSDKLLSAFDGSTQSPRLTQMDPKMERPTTAHVTHYFPAWQSTAVGMLFSHCSD